MANTDFIKDILKTSNNKYSSIASDGIKTDVKGFYDTKNYMLNALISGSLYGGIPQNKITVLAGKSGVGKTFFTLELIKTFLEDHPEKGYIVFFETEGAVTSKMLTNRGIDTSRILSHPIVTVEEFRTQASNIIDKYSENDEDGPKIMIVLDSIGMLSTRKETEDIAAGEDKVDMTRAKLLKGAFRVLTLKAAVAQIPIVMTNHVYQEIGMFPKDRMGGGEGAIYAGTNVIFLSRKKDKDGNEVVGNIIHCKNEKSRTTIENKKVDVRLDYKTGLDKYYGLADFAVQHGVWEKMGNRIVVGDKKLYKKHIEKNPEEYFTEDVMNKLEECAKKEFLYGSDEEEEITGPHVLNEEDKSDD